MINRDLNAILTPTVSLIPAARTASGNGASLDIRTYTGDLVALVQCQDAGAGTLPTADFTLEDSADNSSFAANTAALSSAFTQTTTTATCQKRKIDLRACRRYVRIVFTIGGTDSPSFACNAHFLGQKNVA